MSIKNKKELILSRQCQICTAPAIYSFFGAVSCQSCKMFFRRNAMKQNTFQCQSNGLCEITDKTRHICSACRLKKCFQCGMSIDKFRSQRSTKHKTKTQLPTLNLLQSDQSLLTRNQWTLLTNLIHCYKESDIFSYTQRLTDTHHMSQFLSGFYQGLVDEFLLSVYEAAAIYIRSNDDIRKLPIDDRNIVVRNAADNVCCMGGAFIMQFYHLHNLNIFSHIMNVKYGKQTMDIHQFGRKYIDYDMTLIKLGISLFAFSENTSAYDSNELTNPIKVFEIQNTYADITWKYLLYRYGQYQAIKRFLNLTLWLASMHVLASHAQTLKKHLEDIHSIVEQTELSLVLKDIDEIVETD